MYYYSEKDIRDIVARAVAEESSKSGRGSCRANEMKIPVEVSARHVHLTHEAVETLFGKGYQLTHRKDLSQPGEFLSNERVKIVTLKGEIGNVAVLGPERKAVQAELSLTDARTLGVKAPVNLSGDLTCAADLMLVGPCGVYCADASGIVAKAHIHMTPKDARDFNVKDGDRVSVKLHSSRPITIDDCIIRVRDNFALAMHIDFDEANAAQANGETYGTII